MRAEGRLEAAVPMGGDRVAHLALLQRVHGEVFAGRRPPAQPRAVIAESWARLRRRGVRPEHRTRATAPIEPHTAPEDRAALLGLLPAMSEHLDYLVEDDAMLLAVADADATVVHCEGGQRIRELTDQIGFGAGVSWGELHAGTNAIGTALTTRRPVQVHGAEHLRIDQHGWTCAGAPVRDPRSGRVLGVVNLSTTAEEAERGMLGFASLLARTAVLELRERHRRDLSALRSASWVPTRGVRGPWLVVDRWGWVASAEGVEHIRRVALPPDEGGWVLGIGDALAEPLHDGWLLRPADRRSRSATAELRILVGPHGARLRLDSATGGHETEVTRRQADILQLLAHHPAGFSAPQLSALLYGTPERDVTVRAEISRLRRQLGDVIVASPYRFAPGIDVGVVEV